MGKKAQFKMKQGGFTPAAASSSSGYNDTGKGTTKFAGKGAMETPQESAQFPKGEKVEITGVRFILDTYAEGAKKMRLDKFTSEPERKPKSKKNLEVVGSFQYKGASRDGLTTGMMIVGIRNPEDGEEYLISAGGLKKYVETEEDKLYRAKLAREGLLNCTKVTDVSAKIQKEGVRLPDGTFLGGATPAAELPAKKEDPKADAEDCPEDQPRSRIAQGARMGTLRTPLKKPTMVSFEKKGVLDDDGIWLDDAYWLQATSECSEADGCMDINVGDWIWIQFEGRGESYGWLYGTDAKGIIAGWIPVDIACDGGQVTKNFSVGPAETK